MFWFNTLRLSVFLLKIRCRLLSRTQFCIFWEAGRDKVIVIVPCLLCRGCYCLREELCTPSLYYPNLSGVSLCGKSCVDAYSGDPSVWRPGRRAVARTSKHISVIAVDPLSLTLSYTLHCFILFISYIYAWYCLCVPILVLNQESFIEEIVQSPSPGIRLHSLVTLNMLQLVFNSASFVIRLAIHLFTPL